MQRASCGNDCPTVKLLKSFRSAREEASSKKEFSESKRDPEGVDSDGEWDRGGFSAVMGSAFCKKFQVPVLP